MPILLSREPKDPFCPWEANNEAIHDQIVRDVVFDHAILAEQRAE
jgi:hypothetical protein